MRMRRTGFTLIELLVVVAIVVFSSASFGVTRPPKTLINPQATAEARSLMSFLVDQYGQKVLAGQQDLIEIDYINSVTGRQPAVGVFDLMDYSPSRIEHGADPTGLTESWIQWANTGGGIVSLSWHWNAPTDLIDEPDHEWWRGFYTHATTFDIEAVLADPAGERYQLLIRDLDAIAAELAKFQAAGLPVLWRPLHEASGGWFWWGAKGAEPFIELWRLMYDRYVNHHGLHHLIWVYTVGDPGWYPGDGYVDIVGMDIYPSSPDAGMAWEWQETQSRHEGVKLVALSESGIVPDPNKIRAEGVWWSWFSVWNGHFIRDTDPVFLSRVYGDEDVITLDELADWRHYPADSVPPSCSIRWPVDGIKVREQSDLVIRAEAGDADGAIDEVEFFNGVFKLGEDASAPFEYSWSDIPEGRYVLSARAVDDDGIMTTSAKHVLTVGSYTAPEEVRFEAEDAASDGPTFSTGFAGYSGSGSMLFNGAGGTGLDFTVPAAKAGQYPLRIRYLIPGGWGDKDNTILRNGESLGTPTFVNTNGAWVDFDFGPISLEAGSSTLRIEHNWGWMYVDYISLELPGETPGPAGDLNMDGGVDLADLAVLALGWLNSYNHTDLGAVSSGWRE